MTTNAMLGLAIAGWLSAGALAHHSAADDPPPDHARQSLETIKRALGEDAEFATVTSSRAAETRSVRIQVESEAVEAQLAPTEVAARDAVLVIHDGASDSPIIEPLPAFTTFTGRTPGGDGAFVSLVDTPDGTFARISPTPSAPGYSIFPAYLVADIQDTDLLVAVPLSDEASAVGADPAPPLDHADSSNATRRTRNAIDTFPLLLDTDSDLFAALGSSVPRLVAEAQMLVAETNVALERDIAFTHRLKTLSVRTSPEEDPYAGLEDITILPVRDGLRTVPGYEDHATAFLISRNVSVATSVVDAFSAFQDPAGAMWTNSVGFRRGALLTLIGLQYGSPYCVGEDCGVMCLGFNECGLSPLRFGTASADMIRRYIDVFAPEPPVIIECTGDIDDDGDTDFGDFGAFVLAFDASLGDPHYNSAADFNDDGDVDMGDFATFVADFDCTRTVALPDRRRE